METMWTFIFIISGLHLVRCQVDLTHNSASVQPDTFFCGAYTKFTCTIDPPLTIMSWTKDGSSLTDCPGYESCYDATKDNYQFTSDILASEFYITVNPVNFDNAGTFTCSNGASVDDSRTISIAEVPSAITMTQESGTGTITLEATTDCAFPMSDVSIKWYYLKELTDTPKLYTGTAFTPVRTEDSSTCTSGDCTSGVGVSKVVSTVTFDEKENSTTAYYLQAKMEHKAVKSNSSSVVVTTDKKYVLPEVEEDANGLSPGEIAGIFMGSFCGMGVIGVVIVLAIRTYIRSKVNKVDTSRDDESTRSSPKKSKNKLLHERKQRSATRKADGGNKGKQASDTHIHHDKSQKVHPENEEKPFRPQPLPPPGANINNRVGSDSIVARKDVEMEETDTCFKRSLDQDKHGTGADYSFSLIKLPPIRVYT